VEVGWDTVASLAVRVSCCTIAQRSIEVQFLGAKSASRKCSEYYFMIIHRLALECIEALGTM
jgi:hypothetical protein